MKVKDIFSEIFIGVNLNNYKNIDDTQEVYTFKKENIIYNSILYNDYGYNKFKKNPYKSLPNNKLLKINVSKRINEKYFIMFNDIIISIKKLYKVFNDIITKREKFLVTNNYIILRGINSDMFYAPFVSYYIENIGIKKYLESNNKISNELTIEDIKNIEIPNITLKQQIKRYFSIHSRIMEILKYQDEIKTILNKK